MSFGSRIRSRWDTFSQTKRYRDLREGVLTGLDLADKLSWALPDKKDTTLKKGVKIANSIKSVNSVLFMNDVPSVARYVERNKFKDHDSWMFVQIFFSSNLHHEFQMETLTCKDDPSWGLTVARGKVGTLAFVKYRSSKSYQERFYCEKGVSPESLVDHLWSIYDGRIHISMAPGKDGFMSLAFSKVEEIEAPLYGKAEAHMNFYLKRHKRCVAAKEARTYMLYGPPGTGKTSFATRFAASESHKILRLDAQSIKFITVQNMTYLLENLMPDFVLIDDIDKVEVGSSLPALLEVLQSLKINNLTNVMMTANQIGGFDKGLLRPRRIDTWIEFELPDEEERLEVLTSYAKEFVLELPSSTLTLFAKESQGLSQDYLREVIVEMKQSESAEETVKVIHQKRKLLGLVGADIAAKKAQIKTNGISNGHHPQADTHKSEADN